MAAPLGDLFDTAEKACASLQEDDPLRMPVSALLDTVRLRLGGGGNGAATARWRRGGGVCGGGGGSAAARRRW